MADKYVVELGVKTVRAQKEAIIQVGIFDQCVPGLNKIHIGDNSTVIYPVNAQIVAHVVEQTKLKWNIGVYWRLYDICIYSNFILI